MRVLICGDRNWDDLWAVDRFVAGLDHADVVIEGGARGADAAAAVAAARYGVDHVSFPARWQEFGRAAGPIRNKEMLDEGKPDVVVAFHDNLAESKGTRDMVRRARKAGVPVYVVRREP